MKLLVLGATGFVGSLLCARLRREGHETHALVRDAPLASAGAAFVAERTRTLERLREQGVRVHAGELGDPESIARAAEGCEVIVSCAGESSERTPRAVLSWVHVAGMENLLAAARAARVRRLVLLSCADVTLTGKPRVHWKEDAVLGGLPLGALAQSKLLGEELGLHASDESLRVSAVRPGFLWGPGEHNQLPALCAEGLAGGIRLCGSGAGFFATAHVDNVVEALLCAAQTDDAAGRAVHVADTDTLTALEFFERFSRALGLPAPRRGIAPVAKLAAWVRAQAGQQGPLPAEVARRNASCLLDCLCATTLLGAKSVLGVDEGMRALAAWADQVGGPRAIAALARPVPDAQDAQRYAQLADRLG